VGVSGDDVVPRPGVMMRDLVEFVAATYHFLVKPTIPSGIAPFTVPNYVFQSGQFVLGENKWPIVQLAIIPNGDIVTAEDTDAADKIMDDFMTRLDETFGYRFATAEKRRVYQSNLVVEFNPGLSEKIDSFKRDRSYFESASIRPAPFSLKRLAFGWGDVQQTPTLATINDVENTDFTIERRSGEPYSRNRFFCSAPMRTSGHIRILHEIEAALS
jgi:hypothetical protein